MPTVVTLLAKRREVQDQERAAAPSWTSVTYGGERLNLVFTTPTGGLVLRQTVAKVVKQAAKTAGITADLATHAGRRTGELLRELILDLTRDYQPLGRRPGPQARKPQRPEPNWGFGPSGMSRDITGRSGWDSGTCQVTGHAVSNAVSNRG
jgi:hypothetical protein